MSTYVVGDLHGQFSLLLDLLRKVLFDKKKDRLIAVGDVLDRGSRVGDLLFFLHEASREGWFLSVKGNHEESFLRFRSGESLSWYTAPEFGGGVTLSFFQDVSETQARILEEWIASWPLVWSSEKFLVVHGSLPPVAGTALGDHELCETRIAGSGGGHECLELRPPNLYPSWDGRLVVSGHTIVRKAGFWHDGIALVDTGAYRTGVLSAFCLETGQFFRVSGIPV
ncbi:MAG: metallophosphoesterase [Nitrospirae bacterium]|nr:MAG: Metallophosphoesterase [Leptospirillum sp. Group IV 'UBA BS']MCL4484971.1 metallophosphoesterase [Nitrospirota bacterium]MCL5286214.1 metallophosphoesterase [Nitrospirota bacterium]